MTDVVASGRPGPGPDEHAWIRMMSWWHAGFAVTVAATGTWAAVELAGDPGRLAAVLSLYAALALLYGLVFTGRCGSGRIATTGYLVGAFAVFTAACFIFAGSGFLLFVLIPHCFMLLGFRPAMAAVIGLTAINAAADLSNEGISAATVATTVLFGVLGFGLAVLFGGYVSRIIEQSKQRADLIDELARTREELAELNRAAGALAERERLAQEIHDALAQGFTSVILLLQAATAALDRGDVGAARHQLGIAEPAARDGLAEARSLIAALAPPHLQGDSLPGALERVCADLGPRFGFAAVFRIEGAPRPVGPNAEIVLLRAAQEALANVGRHARAAAATVTLAYEEGAVTLNVDDDGIGFDGPRAGFGLEQLRARAAQLGGRAEVGRRPEGGTAVRVVIPDPAGCAAVDPASSGGWGTSWR